MRGGRRQTTSVEERGRSNMCLVSVSHNAPGMQLARSRTHAPVAVQPVSSATKAVAPERPVIVRDTVTCAAAGTAARRTRRPATRMVGRFTCEFSIVYSERVTSSSSTVPRQSEAKWRGLHAVQSPPPTEKNNHKRVSSNMFKVLVFNEVFCLHHTGHFILLIFSLIYIFLILETCWKRLLCIPRLNSLNYKFPPRELRGRAAMPHPLNARPPSPLAASSSRASHLPLRGTARPA